MRPLKWPETDKGPLDKKPGASWVELAVSWMAYNHRYLPVLCEDGNSARHVVLPGNDTDAVDFGCTLHLVLCRNDWLNTLPVSSRRQYGHQSDVESNLEFTRAPSSTGDVCSASSSATWRTRNTLLSSQTAVGWANSSN